MFFFIVRDVKSSHFFMFMPWDAKTKITNVLSLDKTEYFLVGM